MTQRVHSITIVLLCSSIISLQFTNWSRALSHLEAQYLDYESKILVKLQLLEYKVSPYAPS